MKPVVRTSASRAGCIGPCAGLCSCLVPARAAPCAPGSAAARYVRDTGGVPPKRCIAERNGGDPVDPLFPEWWSIEWAMYRIRKGYPDNPPPYASPPGDHEVSYGASYYDAGYRPANGNGESALMAHYQKRYPPIFLMENKFPFSFVSQGDKAYFLLYRNRPAGPPPVLAAKSSAAQAVGPGFEYVKPDVKT